MVRRSRSLSNGFPVLRLIKSVRSSTTPRVARLKPYLRKCGLDQGTPVPLREALSPHEVVTAYERGWSSLGNGALLDATERDGFDMLVTTDKNLRYQQNLGSRRIALS